MKAITRILPFLLLFSSLTAYELGTESYDRYVIMDHSNSTMGLTYPLSWLQPSGFLFDPCYEDSSYTFARWDQLFMIDRSAGGYYNFSADITVRYFPYSFPHRWGAAVEFLDYKGPAATKRADAVLHYRIDKTNVLYYHTNNDQMLTMRTSDRHYKIRTHGLRFDHGLSASLQLRGGISYSRIDQGSTAEQKDDTYHNFAEIRYHPDKPYIAYTMLEHRYLFNNGQDNSMVAVRPGIRYMSDIFSAHIAYRISPKQSFPIAQLVFHPGPVYLETYAKVREPLIQLRQKGHSYVGMSGKIDLDKKNHHFLAYADLYYDIIRSDPAGLPVNNDFYGIHSKTEYRYKLPSMEFYGRASYHRTIDPQPGYYYPEISTLTAGYLFRAGLVDGKLAVSGDMNAQFIVHDDPLKVRFDPVKLIYSREADAQPVGDWRINLKFSARVQTFRIAVDISTPLKAGKDIPYYLYEGIYTSSDFFYGNTFYAAISIDWSWWK